MDNTFLNIGKTITSDDNNRIEFHPLVETISLEGKNKKIDSDWQVIKFNLDDNTVTFEEEPIMSDSKSIKIIKHRTSISDTTSRYIAGNIYIKDFKKENKFKEHLSYSKFENKFAGLLPKDSFILKFRKLMDEKYDIICNYYDEIYSNIKLKNIAILIEIQYNGKRDEAHGFIECLNEIDELFFNESLEVESNKYVFKGSFYSMFNYSKYEYKNRMVKYENSIPKYSFDDFKSLYYAKSIFKKNCYNVTSTHKIAIFPNYNNMTINELKELLFENKNPYNLNDVCNTIQTFIDNRIIRNRNEGKLIKLLLTFDLYYRYNAGNAGIQNMLRIPGVRYVKLLEIRKIINDAYNIVYNKPNIENDLIKTALDKVLMNYKHINSKEDNSHDNLKLKILVNIFQGNFKIPPIFERNLIEYAEHRIRMYGLKNWEDEKSYNWNDNFNLYKFLKIMENSNYVNELENNDSYKLGTLLAKFDESWKKENANLEKAVDKFAGNLLRKCKSIDDVIHYYNDISERMVNNGITIPSHNELIDIMKKFNTKFNKDYFAFGFHTEKGIRRNNKTNSKLEINNQI